MVFIYIWMDNGQFPDMNTRFHDWEAKKGGDRNLLFSTSIATAQLLVMQHHKLWDFFTYLFQFTYVEQ